jgi:hypothetical protein
MTQQQYDSGQWADPVPPAPRYQETRVERVRIAKPFRTGIMLGFGFMVAWLIVSAVVFGVLTALGVGLAGVFEVPGGLAS